MEGAVGRARGLRREATVPERRLWGFLRGLRGAGWHFRRQAPFRGYFLDFVAFQGRVVIEVDGALHGEAARVAHDAVRDGVLRGEGFAVWRFSAAEVSGNFEGVCGEILRRLEGGVGV